MIAETSRLVLRPLQPDDAEALHPVFSDPQANRFTLRKHEALAQTVEWINGVLGNYAKRGFGPWCVVRKSDNAVIGYCGCGIIELDGKTECEIGYRILRGCWGKGLATEAVRAALDHALGDLSFGRVVALIQPDNAASIRVAQKAGMEYERDWMYEGILMRVYVAHSRSGRGS